MSIDRNYIFDFLIRGFGLSILYTCGRYELFFASTALDKLGGIASPPNALAINGRFT